MIWFFYKDGEHLHYEIRTDGAATNELVVRFPDGSERLERFEDSNALNKRVLELQQELTQDGWSIIDQRR